MIEESLIQALKEDLQKAFAEWLRNIESNEKLSFEVSNEEISEEFLSEEEKQRLLNYSAKKSKSHFLIGRKALSDLIGFEERKILKFPHPKISLSHSNGLAIAVKAEKACGIGLDIQEKKVVSRNLSRKFLSENEKEFCQKNIDILQLWCIKESVFKANLKNRNTFLKDYKIKSFRNGSGTVVWEGVTFYFFSIDFESMFISLALKSN